MKGDFVMPNSWYEPPEDLPATCLNEDKDCRNRRDEDADYCPHCHAELEDEFEEKVDDEVRIHEVDAMRKASW